MNQHRLQRMRTVLLLILMLLVLSPMQGYAAEECPVGYIKNSLDMCERQNCKRNALLRCLPGQVVNDAVCPARCSPRCPESFYYDARLKVCAPICPNGGTMGIGDRGDVICKLPKTLTEAEKYASRCTAMGRAYIPQTGVCGGAIKDGGSSGGTVDGGPINECAKGKVATRLAGSMACKKANVEQAKKRILAKLEKEGMDYLEFLKASLEVQTNKDMYIIIESRIREVEQQIANEKAGVSPTKAGDVPATPAKQGACPQGYIPNDTGQGCRPERDCSMYRCPNGSVPTTQRSGDSYYCGC